MTKPASDSQAIMLALHAIAHALMQDRLDSGDIDSVFVRDLANACVGISERLGDADPWIEKPENKRGAITERGVLIGYCGRVDTGRECQCIDWLNPTSHMRACEWFAFLSEDREQRSQTNVV